ncbi:hypothetical protein BGZ65_008091, partial [Modicella reniformis]
MSQRKKSKLVEQGSGYFLDLANPAELTPKGYVEHRRAETSHIRDKEIVKEWQGLVTRLGDKPKWKDTFLRVRAWRDTVPQVTTVRNTRSSSKRAAIGQSIGPPASPPSGEESSASSPSSSVPPSRSSQHGTDSSSQSTGSSDSLSPEAVQQLKLEFSINFNDYLGTPWLLSTGTNVDEVIRKYTMTRSNESSLHSFVVDDIDSLRSQFTSQDYDLFLGQVQSFDSQVAPVLPTQVQQEILKYSLSPDALQEYLGKGWRQDEGKSQDGDNFRKSLYLAMLRLSCLYEENQGVIPGSKSESWYATEIWAIFIKLLTRNTTWL